MISAATTVEEYLEEMPDDRREAISALRNMILEVLPEGFEEVMNWGMITYQVPLVVYPDTYNKKPFMFVALASQKNYMALYLMGVYMQTEKLEKLRKGFEGAGKKLDIGKSCIRFRSLDDLAIDPILQIIAECDMESYVERAKSSHPAHR